ncbi:MAG: undecaprenyl-diphosphate phosphatase, partial [Burkholderiales bacterium]
MRPAIGPASGISSLKNLLDALVLGIVEGLTEFLPVSSTGHLILAGDLLGFSHPSREVFYVAIQTGAMLAVVWEYRARFWRLDFRLWRNLAIAFLPAALLGLLVGRWIQSHLFAPLPVALAFIIGGVIILWVERKERTSKVENTQAMTALDALKVGLAQCFALVPG